MMETQKIKKQLLGVLIIILAISVVCITVNFDFNENFSAHKSEVYQLAIDTIIERNMTALEDAEYIAVDLNTIDLTSSEKEEIISYLMSQYAKPVLNATYLDLLKSGVEEELSELSGLLIYVEKTDRNISSVQIHIAIEYASLGAEGVSMKFKFFTGKWIIKEVKEIWVS